MGSVPTPTFGPNGFIEPAEADILAGVFSDINAAFGGGLNPALESPQGQLASSMAAIIGSVNDTFLWYTQQADPAYASGRMQDALARIYFIERQGAEPTAVQALCSGLAGVEIPIGAVAVSADGNIFSCTQGGIIPVSGSITLPFACNTVGPIPCPAGALNQIYRAINGWDSITNLEDGVLGKDTETRQQFEERRALSVATNSLGALPSIQGAVLQVPNVLDVYVTENFTASPLTVGGFTLAAHSVYVAVAGGDPDAIAQAIWSKKAPGCNYNGNTTVTVFDKINYNPPYPSYDVKFEIPASLPVLFAVNIENSAQIPSNVEELIQAAIIAAFAGVDGGTRARIGSKILASRYYSAVAALGPWAQIIAIQIGSSNTAAAEVTGTITGNSMNVTAVASGTLAVGQTIIGEGVLPGTKIASFGSGSGGTGTYNLNLSQTITSETLFGVLADQNIVTVQIDQVPTVSATNIAVTLT